MGERGNFDGRNFLLVSSFTLVLQCTCKSLEGTALIHAILQKCYTQYLYKFGKSADLKFINNYSLCSTGHMLNMYFPAHKSNVQTLHIILHEFNHQTWLYFDNAVPPPEREKTSLDLASLTRREPLSAEY